jgi:hypothetical protein
VAIVVSVVLAIIVVLAGVGLVGWATYGFLRDNSSTGSRNAAPAEPPPPSDTVPAPKYTNSLTRFYRQKLKWHACASNQCTRLTVPLDYAHPQGRTIRLAVLRVPAQQRSRRIVSTREASAGARRSSAWTPPAPTPISPPTRDLTIPARSRPTTA